MLGQMSAASTDQMPICRSHPGAAAFYNGTQQGFLDKWGNAIFLAPMIFGGLVSVVAAAWKFLRAGESGKDEPALDLTLCPRTPHPDNGGGGRTVRYRA